MTEYPRSGETREPDSRRQMRPAASRPQFGHNVSESANGQPLQVIVTGGASGIGRSLAESLFDDGYDVVVIDKRAADLAGVRHLQLDLAGSDIEAQLADLVEPPIFGLANVAGVSGATTPHQVLSVNLLGPKRVTRALLPKMRPGSAIVNVASISASRAGVSNEALHRLRDIETNQELDEWIREYEPSGDQAYRISKHLLVQSSRELAIHLLSAGIRANAVSPGPVTTPILGEFEATMGTDAIANAARAVGRHAEPNEIAQVIQFLLGVDSRWINGANIPVDGGLMVGLRSPRRPAGLPDFIQVGAAPPARERLSHLPSLMQKPTTRSAAEATPRAGQRDVGI